VSGARSVFPAHNGAHLIAASYRTGSDSLATRERNALDDEQNLAGVAAVFTDPLCMAQNGAAAPFVTQEPNEGQSLVAIRSAGEDFLPVVGRAPAVEAIVADLAALRRNAKTEIPTETAYQEGLFVNVGHGSNGVATCPLSAEYLASLICREPLPLDAAEAELISPARFIVRDIKKQTR
jgi:tRNA 5-methylaminomethyl-2-thiouridine biosynthesis bifunctional protein